MESPSSFVQHHEFLDVVLLPFQPFLSDPIGNQSAMSKRGQEATSSEGSLTDGETKANDFGEGAINLVSHSPVSARENPPQDLRDPVNPENVDEGQSSQTSTRKLVRTNQRQEVEYSQVTDLQNMKYTNKPSIHDEGYSTFCNRSTKDHCIEMGIVHVFVNESSHSSWTR